MTFTVTPLQDDQTYDGGDLAAETADGGGLTLREALGLANSAADPDTIDFAAGLSGGTLTLAQGELDITQSVAIDGDINGDGVADIAIDAHGTSRVFNIAASSGDVALNGLVIKNGNYTRQWRRHPVGRWGEPDAQQFRPRRQHSQRQRRRTLRLFR